MKISPGPSGIAPAVPAFATAGLLLLASAVHAQEKPQVLDRVRGNINEPAKLKPTPELIRTLTVPAGFSIAVFADQLEAPRIVKVAPNAFGLRDGAIIAGVNTVTASVVPEPGTYALGAVVLCFIGQLRRAIVSRKPAAQ